MSSVTSPNGQRLQPFSYDDFQGIDSSRDVASLDTGQQQHMYHLKNGYPNFRGIILRDRPLAPRTSVPGDRLISHVTFFGRNLRAWARRDGGGFMDDDNFIAKGRAHESRGNLIEIEKGAIS